MKTKKKVLIGLMALCLAGTAGGVFALTRNAATPSVTTGAFDKAIYLYWSQESSDLTLDNVQDLSAGTPQYRYLTVSPKSSKTVAGTVKLRFTLANSAADKHIEGLTVSVYETASLATDQTVAGLLGASADATLNKSNLTDDVEFSITATNNNINQTVKYYAIQISWSGLYDQNHTSYQLGATLTIAQSFVA